MASISNVHFLPGEGTRTHDQGIYLLEDRQGHRLVQIAESIRVFGEITNVTLKPVLVFLMHCRRRSSAVEENKYQLELLRVPIFDHSYCFSDEIYREWPFRIHVPLLRQQLVSQAHVNANNSNFLTSLGLKQCCTDTSVDDFPTFLHYTYRESENFSDLYQMKLW